MVTLQSCGEKKGQRETSVEGGGKGGGSTRREKKVKQTGERTLAGVPMTKEGENKREK